jgi:CMP-N,N'-diacetyllegionaminic acid synthase
VTKTADDTLVLVTARNGSKRLPGKNLRQLAGRSLLAWTADTARTELPDVEVLLFVRPQELASDGASSVDVALHALDWYEQTHGRLPARLLMLQPTSPFRPRGLLRAAIGLMDGDDALEAVIAVKRVSVGEAHVYREAAGRLQPISPDAEAGQACYVPSGALYLIRTDALQRERSFIPPATGLVPHGSLSTLDIDDLDDWSLAEAVSARFLELPEPD